jgi:hypothetical protein
LVSVIRLPLTTGDENQSFVGSHCCSGILVVKW